MYLYQKNTKKLAIKINKSAEQCKDRIKSIKKVNNEREIITIIKSLITRKDGIIEKNRKKIRKIFLKMDK